MSTHNKLELFRRVSCLGYGDIEKMFEGDYQLDYLLSKYESMMEKYGECGNFKFLFYLDEDYAEKFMNYIGLREITLESKGNS